MVSKTVTLDTFAPMYGWRNRMLRVDLSAGRIWAESAPDTPDFLGARGMAAKILWDEYPEPVAASTRATPLWSCPARSPARARPIRAHNVCAFGPQGYPYTWFTRASIGADWGDELKKAGYDGLVVTGASDTPVRILIRDDEVSILPADDLWGMDTIETQESHRGRGRAAASRRSPSAWRASACRASPRSRPAPPPWPDRAALAP